MKAHHSLLALLPLALASFTGCQQDGAEDPEEMVEVTVLTLEEDGSQSVEIQHITRVEQERMAEERRQARALAAEGKVDPSAAAAAGLGENPQSLTAQQDGGCAGPSLWIYSQPNRTGSMLCVRNVGHDGTGAATFNLPADWTYGVGTKYPQSYWSGEDLGWWYGPYGGDSFQAWEINNTVPWEVATANQVQLWRLIYAPSVDPSINPPSGSYAVHRMRAQGHQIYVCREKAGSPGVYEWTFSAPSALLFDPHLPGDAIGWHYVGPSWQSSDDGSVVKASVIGKVDAPSSTAIPWLLLQATGHTGAGTFSNVQYIQRVNTYGGKAPATGCDQVHLNQSSFVEYSADYYFYGWNVP